MPFKKGNAHGKGRGQGTPNELTKKGKELFYDIIEGQIQHIPEALQELRETSSKDYMMIIVKLMEYVVPKKAEITIPPPVEINIPPINWTKTAKNDEC